jgi:hypothetical protein
MLCESIFMHTAGLTQFPHTHTHGMCKARWLAARPLWIDGMDSRRFCIQRRALAIVRCKAPRPLMVGCHVEAMRADIWAGLSFLQVST